MMSKPAASLSSGLLARKGHARPAMRPQGYMTMTPNVQEDLGWNDMGDEDLYPEPAQFQPQPVAPEHADGRVPAPPVLRQRAELEEQISQPLDFDADAEDEEFDETAEYEAYAPLSPMPVVAPEPVARPEPVVRPAPAPVSAGTLARVAHEVKAGAKMGGAKAAFTLRLDTDRHLRLRLASAVFNRSAQQLVTEALDAFLESMSEVDALACQLSARENCRSGE